MVATLSIAYSSLAKPLNWPILANALLPLLILAIWQVRHLTI